MPTHMYVHCYTEHTCITVKLYVYMDAQNVYCLPLILLGLTDNLLMADKSRDETALNIIVNR